MSIESSLNRAEIAIQVRDNWLKRYQEPPLINKEKAVNAINWLYRLGGLKEPEIIFCDSPKQCDEVYLNLTKFNNTADQFAVDINNYANSIKVKELNNEAISLLIKDYLSYNYDLTEKFTVSIDWYLNKCIESLFEDKSWNTNRKNATLLDESPPDSSYLLTLESAFPALCVTAFVRSTFDILLNTMRDFSILEMDYLEKLNIIRFGSEQLKYFELLESNMFGYIPLKKNCIVCSFPTIIKLDEGFLHSTSGPAIEWRDGTKYYFLEGMNMGKRLWKHILLKKFKKKGIFKIKHFFFRYLAIKYYGVENLVDELDTTILDESIRGNKLYRVYNLNIRFAYFLKYKCPSTGKEYFKAIPPNEVDTSLDRLADRAMAWKFSMTLEEYDNLTVEA